MNGRNIIDILNELPDFLYEPIMEGITEKYLNKIDKNKYAELEYILFGSELKSSPMNESSNGSL
jgi:hypothetical protein